MHIYQFYRPLHRFLTREWFIRKNLFNLNSNFIYYVIYLRVEKFFHNNTIPCRMMETIHHLVISMKSDICRESSNLLNLHARIGKTCLRVCTVFGVINDAINVDTISCLLSFRVSYKEKKMEKKKRPSGNFKWQQKTSIPNEEYVFSLNRNSFDTCCPSPSRIVHYFNFNEHAKRKRKQWKE